MKLITQLSFRSVKYVLVIVLCQILVKLVRYYSTETNMSELDSLVNQNIIRLKKSCVCEVWLTIIFIGPVVK